MSQFDQNAISMLNQANEAWSNARASTGVQEWPPAGEHYCTLSGVSIKASQTDYTNNGAKTKVDGVDIAFEYQWFPADPKEPGFDPTRTSPLEWTGRAVRFIPNYAANPGISDGQKKGLGWDLERLKGAICAILNKDEKACTNLIADLNAVRTLMADTSKAVGVHVRIQHRTYKDRDGNDRTDRKDFIFNRTY